MSNTEGYTIGVELSGDSGMFNDSKDYDSTQNNFIIVAEEEPEIEPVPSIKQALRRKQFLKKINPPRVRYMLPRRA